MKLKDIRAMDSRELGLDIHTLKKEAFELSFRSSSEDLVNPGRHKQIRRTIARIKTVLKEREVKAAKAAAAKPAAAESAKGQSKADKSGAVES